MRPLTRPFPGVIWGTMVRSGLMKRSLIGITNHNQIVISHHYTYKTYIEHFGKSLLTDMDNILENRIFIGAVLKRNGDDLLSCQVSDISSYGDYFTDQECSKDCLIDYFSDFVDEFGWKCVDFRVMSQRMIDDFNAVTYQKITIEGKKQWKLKIDNVEMPGAMRGFEGPLKEDYVSFPISDVVVELNGKGQVREKSGKRNFDQYSSFKNAAKVAKRRYSEQQYDAKTDLLYGSLLLKNAFQVARVPVLKAILKPKGKASAHADKESELYRVSILDHLICKAGLSTKTTIRQLKKPHKRRVDLTSTKMLVFDDMLQRLGIQGALQRDGKVDEDGEVVETLEFIITDSHRELYNHAICNAILSVIDDQEHLMAEAESSPPSKSKMR
jgi:hypothetical protein